MFIKIPIITNRCGKCFCSISKITLRVYKEVTINKSKGITIGPQKPFEKLIAFLPNCGSHASLGLELVAISRAMNPDCITFCNISSELTEM